MKRKITLIILLIFTFILNSCKNDKLEYLSINCLCEATEHKSISTNEKSNIIKEYSFINSRLFELGVSEENFSLSSAVLIQKNLKDDDFKEIKINIINDSKNGLKSSKSFKYNSKNLKELSPKYFEILSFIDNFVKNIYNENFEECLNMTKIEIQENEFKKIMSDVLNGLEENYLNTRIVGYKTLNGEFIISGGVFTENETLDLFNMKLIDSENNLKITAFSF